MASKDLSVNLSEELHVVSSIAVYDLRVMLLQHVLWRLAAVDRTSVLFIVPLVRPFGNVWE
jgi:hypothetical protein